MLIHPVENASRIQQHQLWQQRALDQIPKSPTEKWADFIPNWRTGGSRRLVVTAAPRWPLGPTDVSQKCPRHVRGGSSRHQHRELQRILIMCQIRQAIVAALVEQASHWDRPLPALRDRLKTQDSENVPHIGQTQTVDHLPPVGADRVTGRLKVPICEEAPIV